MATLLNWLEISLLVGLLYAPISVGLAWAFRVLNFPDLTCEGSFICAGATSVAVLNSTGNIAVSLAAAIAVGAMAGMITGLIHIGFGVSRLLSGIVTWAILYSLTIRVLGGVSNLRIQKDTLFDVFNRDYGWSDLGVAVLVTGGGLVAAIILSSSRIGRLMRATGDQPWSVASLGVSPAVMIVLGVGIANAFIGLAGAVICQQRGVCDVNMGSGLLVSGLASMVLGEAVFAAKRVWQYMVIVVLGVVFYNLAITAFYFDWGAGLGDVLLSSDVRMVSGLLLLAPAALVARRLNRYKLFASEW